MEEQVADPADVEVALDDLRQAYLREPSPSTVEQTLARLRAETAEKRSRLLPI